MQVRKVGRLVWLDNRTANHFTITSGYSNQGITVQAKYPLEMKLIYTTTRNQHMAVELFDRD